MLSGDWLVAQVLFVFTGDLIDGTAIIDWLIILFEGAKGLIIFVVCLFFEGFEFFLNRLVLCHDGVVFFRKLLLLLDRFDDDRISILLDGLMLLIVLFYR